MNGNNKNYSIRPLTQEEKEFAADDKNYNYLFFYMRKWHLDPDEWYDILIIPYLDAVKKYHEYESARQFAFSTVLKNKLKTAISAELKSRRAKKRMPEGGICSLDKMTEGDNPFSEYSKMEEWLIDRKASTENNVILSILLKEFYETCITYDDYEDDPDLYDSPINDYLKTEIDLLLDGYTRKQTNRKTEKKYPYGYDVDDLDKDIERFRNIFRKVFGY